MTDRHCHNTKGEKEVDMHRAGESPAFWVTITGQWRMETRWMLAKSGMSKGNG